MKYFYLLLILFSYSFVNAQNSQSYNYALQRNLAFTQETISIQLHNLSEISAVWNEIVSQTSVANAFDKTKDNNFEKARK